jgi:hypothetical protein
MYLSKPIPASPRPQHSECCYAPEQIDPGGNFDAETPVKKGGNQKEYD